MKKFISIFTIVLAALILTGCNNNKLNCSIVQTKQVMGLELDMDQDVVVNFDNEKVDTVKLTSTITLPEEMIDSAELDELSYQLEGCLRAQLEKNDDNASKQITSTQDGRKILIKINYDSIKGIGNTKEKTKTFLSNVGFSCK